MLNCTVSFIQVDQFQVNEKKIFSWKKKRKGVVVFQDIQGRKIFLPLRKS